MKKYEYIIKYNNMEQIVININNFKLNESYKFEYENDLKKKFKYIILFFCLINKAIIDPRKIKNGDFNSKVKYYEHFQNSIPIYNHTHIYIVIIFIGVGFKD